MKFVFKDSSGALRAALGLWPLLGESVQLKLSEGFVHVAKNQMFGMIMTKRSEIKTFLYFFISLALYLWQCQGIVIPLCPLFSYSCSPFKSMSD